MGNSGNSQNAVHCGIHWLSVKGDKMRVEDIIWEVSGYGNWKWNLLTLSKPVPVTFLPQTLDQDYDISHDIPSCVVGLQSNEKADSHL